MEGMAREGDVRPVPGLVAALLREPVDRELGRRAEVIAVELGGAGQRVG
jgi:hypothetical protein